MEDHLRKYYVYVLRSLKTGYRYIGQTNDLGRRFQEHDEGFTASIRYQRPFAVAYIEVFPTRVEATQREKFFKSGKGREWLDIHEKS